MKWWYEFHLLLEIFVGFEEKSWHGTWTSIIYKCDELDKMVTTYQSCVLTCVSPQFQSNPPILESGHLLGWIPIPLGHWFSVSLSRLNLVINIPFPLTSPSLGIRSSRNQNFSRRFSKAAYTRAEKDGWNGGDSSLRQRMMVSVRWEERKDWRASKSTGREDCWERGPWYTMIPSSIAHPSTI